MTNNDMRHDHGMLCVWIFVNICHMYYTCATMWHLDCGCEQEICSSLVEVLPPRRARWCRGCHKDWSKREETERSNRLLRLVPFCPILSCILSCVVPRRSKMFRYCLIFSDVLQDPHRAGAAGQVVRHAGSSILLIYYTACGIQW